MTQFLLNAAIGGVLVIAFAAFAHSATESVRQSLRRRTVSGGRPDRPDAHRR